MLSHLNSERLGDYLSQLSPEVAVFLIREIERQRADGKDDPVYDLVLEAARRVIRISGAKVARMTEPMRLFCEPFEDLLVDDDRNLLQRGRICRPSIERVWKWLNSGEAHHDLSPVAREIQAAAKRGNLVQIDGLRTELLERSAEAIEHALEVANASSKAKMKIEARIGGRGALFDAREMSLAIRAAPAIRALREALPIRINEFDVATVEAVSPAVEDCIDAVPRRPEFAFAVLIFRCSSPAQALRLAVHRTGSNNAGQLAIGSFAGLGNLLLHDLRVIARQVDDMIRDDASAASILFALSRYFGYADGFEQELEISVRSPWGEHLAGARRLASESLDKFIRSVPGLLSGLLKPRIDRVRGGEEPWPDPRSVQDVERALTILVGCRPFLDQLSVHEAVTIADEILRNRLNLVADKLLGELRHCVGMEKRAARAWLDAVVSLTRILVSETDADLLERSGIVAAQVAGTGTLAPGR